MERLKLAGAELEIRAEGQGRPLLFLHGEDFHDLQRPFVDKLATFYRLIAPRHPGFGNSTMPADYLKIDDLAYLYLDLIEELKLDQPIVVGASLGGWIALELAVRAPTSIDRLVLIGSVGVKLGGREEQDFADIYQLPEEEVRNLTFADPARFLPSFATLPDEALMAMARDRETATHFAWRPYMHNPVLRNWLHRVRMPALLLWGDKDGVVRPDYARKLAGELPNAELQLIANAGHYPQIEKAEETLAAISAFTRT